MIKTIEDAKRFLRTLENAKLDFTFKGKDSVETEYFLHVTRGMVKKSSGKLRELTPEIILSDNEGINTQLKESTRRVHCSICLRVGDFNRETCVERRSVGGIHTEDHRCPSCGQFFEIDAAISEGREKENGWFNWQAEAIRKGAALKGYGPKI